jgi:hypothetical protein
LDRESGLELLAHLDDYRRPGGAFLTFVMVPTASRFGDWLFAGVSRSLADAVDRAEEFIAPRGSTGEVGTSLLRYLLEPEEYEEGWHFTETAPIDGLGPHRVVLCVQADAPHDDAGVCIVEVPRPADSAGEFAELAVAGWRVEAVARMQEAGTRLWGPPPPDVRATLEQRSRPADWTRWSQSEWGENPKWSLSPERAGPAGWGDVVPPELG